MAEQDMMAAIETALAKYGIPDSELDIFIGAVGGFQATTSMRGLQLLEYVGRNWPAIKEQLRQAGAIDEHNRPVRRR